MNKFKEFLYSLGTLSGIRIHTVLPGHLVNKEVLRLFETAEAIDLLPPDVREATENASIVR